MFQNCGVDRWRFRFWRLRRWRLNSRRFCFWLWARNSTIWFHVKEKSCKAFYHAAAVAIVYTLQNMVAAFGVCVRFVSVMLKLLLIAMIFAL